MSHNLLIKNCVPVSVCDCGEEFSANTAGFKQWEAHIKIVELMHSLYVSVAREYAARNDAEKIILELVAKHVPAEEIARAAGLKEDGKRLMTAASVNRIVRAHTPPVEHTKVVRKPRKRAAAKNSR